MAVTRDNSAMIRALSIIDSLQHGWYNPPVNYYQKRINFETQSYRHSAIREILFYLLDHVDESPISAIEDFRRLVDGLSCIGPNENVRFMFSVYYDVATEVLDVLISNIRR